MHKSILSSYYNKMLIAALTMLVTGELVKTNIVNANSTFSSSIPKYEGYIVPVESLSTPKSSPIDIDVENLQINEVEELPSNVVEESSENEFEEMPINVVEESPAITIEVTPEFSGPNTEGENEAPVLQTTDLVVIATDIQVIGATEELKQFVLNNIRTRSGGETSQSQLQQDVATVLNTGFFTDVKVTSYSNPNGLNVLFEVQPVILRSLQLQGANVLPQGIVEEIFAPQLGGPASLASLNQGFEQLTTWYQENNYTLAQVLAIQPRQDGVLSIEVAEGVIGSINIRFFDQEGEAKEEGRTRTSFIQEELQLQPGEVFRLDTAQQDLQRLYQLGLFETVDITLNGDARNLDLTYEIIEAPARGINVGGGLSNENGIFGTIRYNDRNLGGINQKLDVNLQVGLRDFQFDTSYSNPYRASKPDRLGYSVNTFRRRNLSQTFNNDVDLPNDDSPREGRFGGGIALSKPLNNWNASVGLNYTRTSIRDSDGEVSPVDELGNRLSFSNTGIDDLVTLKANFTNDQRNNPINPTSGSVLNFTTEQSVPVGSGSILMNRLQASYSNYTPIKLLSEDNPEVLAFNVQGGTTIGDLPPYQAFNLGGINSVRGYGSGDVGSGRSYVLASAEYRFPLFSLPVGGVLFADFASDLGSGDTVPGEPGEVRGKPGIGFGYGAGLRVNSPIGILRADFGINDQGDSRLQFGIGQRF